MRLLKNLQSEFFLGKLSLPLSVLALLIATLFHVYRENIFLVKPTDFFMALFIFFSLPTFLDFKRWDRSLYLYVILLLGIFSSVVLATLLGYLNYGLVFDGAGGYRLILKLLLNIISFFAVFFVIKKNREILSNLTICFWISYLIYLPVIFLPESVLLGNFLSGPTLSTARFMGFGSNPNEISYSLYVCIPLLLPFLFCSEKKISIFLFSIFLSFLFFLLIWAGSRVPILITLFSISFFLFEFFKYKPFQLKPSSVLVIFSGMTASFLILFMKFPYVLWMFLYRVTGTDFSNFNLESSLSVLSHASNYVINSLVVPSTEGNVRLMPFNHYFNICRENLFGVGVNYFPTLAFEHPTNHELMLTESFLDTFIHGGLLLVFFLAYFSYKILQINYKNYSNSKNFLIFLSLRSVFLGSLVLAFIGGYPIYALRTWIIAAMILSFNY